MASLSDLLSALQNGVVAINGVNKTLGEIFPGATAISTVALSSAGGLTFSSSQAVGFISITTSSGYQGQIPVYPG